MTKKWISTVSYRPVKEMYEAPITMSYSNWGNYVGSGFNTSLGGAVIPGGTSLGGAVINGHPRQNFETASFPFPENSFEGTPGENHVGYQPPNLAFSDAQTRKQDKEQLRKFLQQKKDFEEEEGVESNINHEEDTEPTTEKEDKQKEETKD